MQKEVQRSVASLCDESICNVLTYYPLSGCEFDDHHGDHPLYRRQTDQRNIHSERRRPYLCYRGGAARLGGYLESYVQCKTITP